MDENTRRQHLVKRLDDLFKSGYKKTEFMRRARLSNDVIRYMGEGRAPNEMTMRKIERFFEAHDRIKEIEDEYGI